MRYVYNLFSKNRNTRPFCHNTDLTARVVKILKMKAYQYHYMEALMKR